MLSALLVPRAAHAQRGREWRVQPLAVLAPHVFVGAGGGLTLRTRAGVGAGVMAALGERAGRAAGRGEALLSFALDPLRERGLAPYAAAGVAVLGDATGAWEYLVALVGVSANPGARRGWFMEAGVGGGVRLSAGLAFR